AFHVGSLARTLSMRSSSTQPPETEPTTWPSSRTATIAPTGRGAEPQVFTMVPSATLWPPLRHCSAVRSTSISTLSMGKCYPNSAAASRAVLDGNACGVTRSDLAHDGEAQSAARSRRAGNAVEALEDAAALRRRNSRAVVLDFEERVAIAPSGAHGDASAARRILDRVVDQVGERFAQEEGIAFDRRGLELEAEVDVADERLSHPGFRFRTGQLLQVDLLARGARARLGAREREELVGEARGADGRLVHLLELRAARLGHLLRKRDLGMGLQAGERRAQLMRGVGE